MDIKVKTSTGISLVDCTYKSIGLSPMRNSKDAILNCIVVEGNNGFPQIIGAYETETRAAEVFSLITTCIDSGFKRQAHGIIIEMPEK